MAQEMTVAFGLDSITHFVCVGGSTHAQGLPTDMKSAHAGKLNNPITYASMGPSGRWYMLGHGLGEHRAWDQAYWELGTLSEELQPMLSEHPICSVSFGPGDAWCWSYHSGDVYEHSYNHLAPDQAAWIAKTEANYGSRFRIFIGAGEATVMIFANGHTRHWGTSHRLDKTLDAASRQSKRIRYIALSPTNRDYFFIQFEDGGVVYWASKHIVDKLKGHVQQSRIEHLNFETLEVMDG